MVKTKPIKMSEENKQIIASVSKTVKILQFKGSDWIKIDDLIILLNESEGAFKNKSDLHNIISALLKLKN